MTVRYLKLFFSDDHDATQECPFVEIVTDPGFSWVGHCYDTFETPRITFDLLSSDINFTEDITDPGQPGGAVNSWGLIHALAALARRDHAAYGSQLPLAWEVRSFSPDAYKDDPNATRAYGLLRSMAACPRPGESLEQCIWREHQERRQPPPGLPFEAWKAQGLSKIFADDLAAQQARGTDAVKACQRLLPQWRDRFRQAAADGQVRICESFNAVRGGLPKGGLVADSDRPIGLPIMAEGGGVQERLHLFSIFADLVRHDPAGSAVLELDTPFQNIRIPGQPGDAFTVRQWLVDLGRAAKVQVSYADPDVRFELVLNSVFDPLPSDPRDGHDEAWASGEPLRDYMAQHGRVAERAMILCALVFHRTMEGHNDVSSRTIADRYSLAINPKTWSWPIKKAPSIFPQIGGPDTLARELQKALREEPHRLGEHATWMLRGLKRWIAGRAGEQLPGNWRTKVRTYAPAVAMEAAAADG